MDKQTSAPPPYSSPPPIMQPPPPESRVVFHSMNFGSVSQRMICPHCHADINTNVKVEANTKTHLFALILCLTTCCCCIPYCINSCQSSNHYCPNCNAYLGGKND